MIVVNEITLLSYWEHFKRAKELALVYPLGHPERILIEKSLTELAKKLKLK